MNTDADDELERLREQLRQALHSVRLAPGSEARAIRVAHRRRWLRRGLAGAGVVALVGGGIVAVSAGDSSGPGELATRADTADGATAATDPIREVAPVVPTTGRPAPTTAVAMFSVADEATAPEESPAAVDYPPAVAIDPLLNWSEVTPGPGLEPPASWIGRVPGVVIGTGTGTGTADWAAYYTADGIAFEPLDVVAPSGSLIPPVPEGDTIYSVGVVESAGAARPLVVDVSPDRGASWSSVSLPIDTAPPFESEHVSIWSTPELIATDGGLVVLVTERAEFDPSGFPELGESGATMTDQNGVTVFDECGTTDPSQPAATPEPCEQRAFTWEQLGLTDAEAGALREGPRTRAFQLDGELVVELDLPPDTAAMGVAQPGLFYRSVRGPDGQSVDDLNSWRLTADGAWQEVEVAPDLAPFGAVPYTVGEATLVLGANADSTTPVFGVSTGSGWEYATSDGLFGEHALPFAAATVSTGELLAASFSTRTDLIAAEGGVEVESDGVIVRREGEVEEWLVLAADDRAPIAGATIDWNTAAGGIVVRDEGGAALATFDAAAIDPLLDPASPPSWSIVTTVDGLHVAVEPVAELLDVAVDEIVDVRLNAAGDNVLATVTLADSSRHVLLGVPTS